MDSAWPGPGPLLERGEVHVGIRPRSRHQPPVREPRIGRPDDVLAACLPLAPACRAGMMISFPSHPQSHCCCWHIGLSVAAVRRDRVSARDDWAFAQMRENVCGAPASCHWARRRRGRQDLGRQPANRVNPISTAAMDGMRGETISITRRWPSWSEGRPRPRHHRAAMRASNWGSDA